MEVAAEAAEAEEAADVAAETILVGAGVISISFLLPPCLPLF